MKDRLVSWLVAVNVGGECDYVDLPRYHGVCLKGTEKVV